MVPERCDSPAAIRWELDSLARLARVRDVAEAILIGHWPAEPCTLDALSRLTRSASRSARYAAACRR